MQASKHGYLNEERKVIYIAKILKINVIENKQNIEISVKMFILIEIDLIHCSL